MENALVLIHTDPYFGGIVSFVLLMAVGFRVSWFAKRNRKDW